MKSVFVSAATAFAMLATTPVFAGEAHSVAVDYSDLNVGSIKGQQVLQRRIAKAAREACNVGGTRDINMLVREKACVKSAYKSAQSQLAAAGIGLAVAAR